MWFVIHSKELHFQAKARFLFSPWRLTYAIEHHGSSGNLIIKLKKKTVKVRLMCLDEKHSKSLLIIIGKCIWGLSKIGGKWIYREHETFVT